MNILFTSITWLMLFVCGFFIIATNLSNMHIEADGSKQNKVPFPHKWVAGFIFCFLLLLAHYDFGL